MARKKGTYSLSANIETNAAAPLDARTVVDAMADLTTAANFPYPYVGMPVWVKAVSKLYVLTANDVTVSGNWLEVGSGASGGGHEIRDDGTAMADEPALNFTDFDLSDNDTDGQTEIAPHELTAAELAEIVSPLPGVMSRRFKYSTDEQIVGEWIDGKPIYQTTVNCGALPNNDSKSIAHGIANIYQIVDFKGIAIANDNGEFKPINYARQDHYGFCSYCDKTNIYIKTYTEMAHVGYVTIQYTKTTD